MKLYAEAAQLAQALSDDLAEERAKSARLGDALVWAVEKLKMTEDIADAALEKIAIETGIN